MLLAHHINNNTRLANIFTSFVTKQPGVGVHFNLSINLETYQPSIRKFIFSIVFLYFLTLSTECTANFVDVKRLKMNV
jgi:hypothetical protein